MCKATFDDPAVRRLVQRAGALTISTQAIMDG